MVYRINVTKLNRKRVSSRKSGAGFQRFVHHESEKGQSKRRNTKVVYEKYRAIVVARGESECKYVCGVSGVRNTRERTGKEELLYV